MVGARDLADKLEQDGKGFQLNQFSNDDNPGSHTSSTGNEIWKDTQGEVTHFVSSMGTTGTIMGVSTALKKKNKDIQIIGVQPEDGSKIAGIRRWPKAYLPKIFDASKVDSALELSKNVSNATIVTIACDRGDRYLSTGIFSAL